MPRTSATNACAVPGARPAVAHTGASGRRSRAGRTLPAGCAAFTLVELAVAIALAAAIVGLALPSFRDWLGAYELANHARLIAETMMRARTEAVRRGHRVSLCKSPDRRQCADHGAWSDGFVVFVDVNHDGNVDDDEPVIALEGPAPPGITVRANRPLDAYVSYTSLGQARMLNGALQMGTITVCRRDQRAVHVVLANSGRVRIEKTGERCS
jgi:type IV fimbrial biogenesis protein FimT